MKEALLFRENEDPIVVSAEDVANGLYSRHEEFVDIEYEFKVQFVKNARNNGKPYFRFYYSYEDFKHLYPERASRYEIVMDQRRYDECQWHKKWKNLFSHFCEIEKCIKNESIGKWKFADAYYSATNTCIEFQHSYISFNFEERNEFYSNLSINTIWLYDLPKANARKNKEGNIEILEDNARGFFRISEIPENIKNNYVFIQVKSGKIYRVCELFRYDSSNDKKSTIRYFIPSEVYTEEEFIDAVKNKKIGKTLVKIPAKICVPKQADIHKHNKNFDKIIEYSTPQPLWKLWNSSFSSMRVKRIDTNDTITINCDNKGEMYRNYYNRCIQYTYTESSTRKEYCLSHEDEYKPIWIRKNYTKKKSF